MTQQQVPLPSRAARACRRKFLRYFPRGFRDEKYVAWERGYKEEAHRQWEETLSPREMRRLLRARDHVEICRRAVRIESRTNLLFSFEKMAVRDAVKTERGAHVFAAGLADLVCSHDHLRVRFTRWVEAARELPHPGTRVVTWPVVTVFGFIARPDEQIFVKPIVTKRAAQAYGGAFDYASRPSWETYASILSFAERVRHDLRDLRPKDMIDVQSFLWVLGSEEYP